MSEKMNEKLINKYMSKIAKKLQCSKGKREKIKKQITSDIMAEIEGGVSCEEVIARMGIPEEIAEGFNSNFSVEEKKKHKKEKWMKRIAVVAGVVVALSVAIYWVFPKPIAIEDSKYFTENELKTQSEYIAGIIGEGDYDALSKSANERMQTVMDPESWNEAKNIFAPDWGELQSYGKTYMSEINQMGKHLAVVQMNVSYENANVTFTISFDKDMKLAGLYMK